MNLIPRLLALVAVVFAIVWVLGSRGDDSGGVDRPSGSGAREVAAPPDANAPAKANAPAEIPAPAAPMNASTAWSLIDQTRDKAGNDTGRQSQLLADRLRQLPGKQILQFARIRRKLDRRAYTWNIWGAAFVIEDGCSDDCFRDFRAYLISLGRRAYDAALRNPDSLAPVVQDEEQGDWENADDVAPDAYEGATGDDYPLDDSDLSGDPRGQPWDDEAQETLVRRYPALAARFR